MTTRLARTATTIATVAAVSGLLAGVATAAHSPFKAGTYRGKTSQGAKFVVKLQQTGECDSGRALCFFTITQPEVKTTCPNGESDEPEDVGDVPVPASGVIRQHSTASNGATEKTVIHVQRNGTITGSFKISGEPDSIDPEEATGTCTGSATFTLKRG